MKPPDALLHNYGGQLKDCFAMGKEELACDFSSLATVLGEGGKFTLPDSLGPSEAEVAAIGMEVTGLGLGSSGGGGVH